MYSSYWKPQDGRESTVLTDHEALHRDAATHRNMQSDETKLRPLDLETIMSSKAAVKFWYLHRPKTMEYVHKNATKIQSVGRAFAVRQLKKKYGIEYMVELAKQDALRREAEKTKDMSDEDRAQREADDAAYDARVEESRRQRREQMEKEREAENVLRAKLAEEAKRRQEAEEARLAALALAAAEQKALEEEERLRQEEARLAMLNEEERAREIAEAARLEEEARRLHEQEEEEARRLETAAIAAEQHQEEEEAAAYAAEMAAIAAEAERVRLEEERLRAEEESLRAEEERLLAEEAAAAEAERIRLEEEANAEAAAAAAALAAEAAAIEEAERRRREQEEEMERREREETERALAAAAAEAQRVEQARQQRIKEEKDAKYEQSLSKDVPVLVRNHGPGRVVSYDKDAETYQVRLDNAMGGMTINVKSSDVNLDDDRILSPRTKVDTPFGTGEVVGLDPHVGCYAINTEVAAPDGEQFLAFVQINDVHPHVEEVEERAIVENPSMPIPDEIALVSARIVDSRVLNRTGKKFIQYKLEIRTSNYGTVYCWKRYSTFRSLCDRLHKEAGIKKKDIPELPKRQIVGNFSQKTIGERAEKLNVFLAAAVQAEHLQWGIRVDDQIAVYKRRVKKPTSSGGFFSRRR